MMLLPTLSSEDELPEDGKNEDEEDEVNDDFLFDTGTFIIPSSQKANAQLEEEENWNVRQRRHNLSLLHATQSDHDNMVERTKLSNIIAVARNNLSKKKLSDDDEESSSADDEASSTDEGELDVDSAPHITDQDVLKSKVELNQGNKDDSENDDEKDIETNDDEDSDEAQKEEEAKKAAFFDAVSPSTTDDTQIIQFSQFALSRPILRSVAAMGYVNPTPIQQRCIPLILAGRDVCASAVTGSGKTAAFLLPILEKILQQKSFHLGASTKALILSPTRELAAQTLTMMVNFSRFIFPHDFIRGCLIVGGAKNVKSQTAALNTRPDIIVATPGRLLDHLLNSTGFTLHDLNFLVLDEADRLLELGFSDEIQAILKYLPKSNDKRQTMLFSATLADTKVDDLIRLSLKRPVRITVSSAAENKTVEVAPRLEQEFVRIRLSQEASREAILLSLLTRTYQNQRLIVFFDTKSLAHRFRIIAGLSGIMCEELHGDLTQPQRLEALQCFREGKVNVLLATDLIGRGIDVPDVDAVLNYDMPNQLASYIHRIGRTARAGRGGKSCTLIGEGRRHLMKEVIKDAEQKNRLAFRKENKSSGEGAVDFGTPHLVAVIRSRTVPPAVVSHYAAKIFSLEDRIKEVLVAEKIAKLDRIAEMEVVRAENIIKHSEEIKSRPPREWLSSGTTKDKQEEEDLKIAQKKQELKASANAGNHRMTRKKRRAREAREALLSLKAQTNEGVGVDAENGSLSANNKAITERSVKVSAKAQKKSKKEGEDWTNKRSLNDDDVSKEESNHKRKKTKGILGRDTSGDGGLFDDEKITFSKKDGEKAVPSSYHFRGYDPNKKFGKGGKKGHNTFKSKKRFKRRK